MTGTATVESSPLLRRMREAIDRVKPRNGRLHVSVARDPRWERSQPNSDEVLVRWLCWSVEDGEVEVLPPEFEVLSPEITQERLSRELPAAFADIEVVLDDEIDV